MTRHICTSGFTLLEVMISMAILSVALSAIIGVNIGAMAISGKAKGIIIASSLARSKMFDLEEELRQKGFPDFDEQMDGDFDAEGYSDIKWVAQIIKIKLPEYSPLQDASTAAQQDQQGGSLLGINPINISPEMSAAMAGLPMLIKQIEEAIREVKVTVIWFEQEKEQSLVVTTHFVNIPGMQMGIDSSIIQQVSSGGSPIIPSSGPLNQPGTTLKVNTRGVGR